MRFKPCPKCGVETTKCGCEGTVQCNGLERCPNEKCDHMSCAMCKFDWCWICSEPSRETRCTKPVKKDKKERFIAASKNVVTLEDVVRSSLDSLADPPSRSSVIALEGIVDGCVSARSHIITIFADAQVAFNNMSLHDLRNHLDDMWDALYVRLRQTCPERAAEAATKMMRCLPLKELQDVILDTKTELNIDYFDRLMASFEHPEVPSLPEEFAAGGGACVMEEID